MISDEVKEKERALHATDSTALSTDSILIFAKL